MRDHNRFKMKQTWRSSLRWKSTCHKSTLEGLNKINIYPVPQKALCILKYIPFDHCNQFCTYFSLQFKFHFDFATCQSLIIFNTVFLIVGSNWELVDGMTWVEEVIIMSNGWIDYGPHQRKTWVNCKSLYEAIGDDVDDYESLLFNTDSVYYEPDEFQQKFSSIQSVSSYCHILNSIWEGFRNVLCDLHG